MSTPTFTWIPSWTPKAIYKPRVLTAQFGDGYAQRAGDGLNTNPASWNLTFSARGESEATAIIDFLDARGGHEPFQWKDINGATYLYVCDDYAQSRTSPLLYEVTATFTQVFNLS